MKPTKPAVGGARIAEILLDLAGLAGAGLITCGAELIYRPAGFIVAGVFLLGGAFLAARKG